MLFFFWKDLSKIYPRLLFSKNSHMHTWRSERLEHQPSSPDLGPKGGRGPNCPDDSKWSLRAISAFTREQWILFNDSVEGISPKTIRWIIETSEPPVTQIQPRKRTRRADDICGVCESYFEEHPSPASVQCDRCEKWFALSCVGIPAYMRTDLQNLDAWRCPGCSR